MSSVIVVDFSKRNKKSAGASHKDKREELVLVKFYQFTAINRFRKTQERHCKVFCSKEKASLLLKGDKNTENEVVFHLIRKNYLFWASGLLYKLSFVRTDSVGCTYSTTNFIEI